MCRRLRRSWQDSGATTGLRVDSEIRGGRDHVWVVIVATAEASDVAEALGLTWRSVLKARAVTSPDAGLVRALAEVRLGRP